MKSKATPHEVQAINWDTPQLVIMESGSGDGKIILTSGEHADDLFDGTLVHLSKDDPFHIGEFSRSWAKDVFIVYDGELTLEN